MKYLGKKVVVTGGTHGMGRAVVEKLIDGGAEVLLAGRTTEKAEGLKAHAVAFDAAKFDDMARLRAEVEERLQDVDLLFINVGYATFTPFPEATQQEYDRTST